jgi:chromosome segregation ATPase
MLVVGLLFGVALTLTVGFFAVLSMGGQFGDNLRQAAAEIRARITGTHRKGQAPSPGRPAEQDARMRALQEEVRVMQRLMDKERVEREGQKEENRNSLAEITSLRARLAEREEQVVALEAASAEQMAAASKMRDELGERSAELARAKQQVKDLETEINVVQSGAGLSAVSDEIARLRAERDELAGQLQRLKQPVTSGKS